MSGSIIAKYVNPWRFRRQQAELRVKTLRQRDGDNCRRCKRPIRFDLTDGHDQGPKVEAITFDTANPSEAIENLCLTHGRCNSKHGCDTAEVKERARIKHEAALFERSRKRRRA